MPVPEVIVFPDVEDTLVKYLTWQLGNRGDTATVHTSVPTTRPDRFVTVPRVGGTKANIVTDSATIAIECYAATPASAYSLAGLVRGLVHALQGQRYFGVTFYRVQEFAGPANLPDPQSDHSRYVFTVSVAFRGVAA